MKRIIIFFFLFAGPSSTLSETDKFPSQDLNDIYPRSKMQGLLNESPSRENLLHIVWNLAQKKDADNRAYLFSLAIDLYHSLPPGKDPTGFNPGEIGGKGMWRRKIMSAIDYSGSSPEQAWERATQSDGVWGEELAYIYHYIRKHVTLDGFDEPASLKPSTLDIDNPVYYAGLRKYVNNMNPAIEASVAPWEAEKYLAAERAEEIAEPQSSTDNQQSNTTKESTENPSSEVAPEATKDNTENKSYVLILVVLAIGIVFIVYVVSRRRKK